MKIIFALLLLLLITISSAIDLDISSNSLLIYGNFNTIELSEKKSENETQTDGLLITFANIYVPTTHEVEDENSNFIYCKQWLTS